MTEKAWQQELEAHQYIASVVRTQKAMDAGTQLAFSFLQTEYMILAGRMLLSTLRVDLLSFLTHLESSSQTWPEVCFNQNSKPHQGDNQN